MSKEPREVSDDVLAVRQALCRPLERGPERMRAIDRKLAVFAARTSQPEKRDTPIGRRRHGRELRGQAPMSLDQIEASHRCVAGARRKLVAEEIRPQGLTLGITEVQREQGVSR